LLVSGIAEHGLSGAFAVGKRKETRMDRPGETTTDLWTYRESGSLGVNASAGIDLVGFEVEAVDGGIGKVDEATYEMSRSYIVVDTGPWIFGKKVMLPAGVVDRVDLDSERVYVDRRKDDIKSAPEFEESGYRDDDYRAKLGTYYSRGV
jgi:hypothetical protein